jgi:hypothetical protein
MAIDRANIDYSNATTESFSTKLYTDEFNTLQLEKSVNVKVTELIKPLPKPNLDLVPRPVYQAEVDLNVELNKEISELNSEIEDLRTQLNQKTADSGSLYISNDFLTMQMATLENKLEANNNIVSELRTGLSTALQKAISENAERTGLEAENAGLNAQKTALLKQIDTLNNLVLAAQQSVAQTQAATANLNQIKSESGAKLLGNLAVVAPQNSIPGKFGLVEITRVKGSGSNYTTRIDGGTGELKISAGAKDVTIQITDDGNFEGPNLYQWTENPVVLKANQVKTINLKNPAVRSGRGNGGYEGGPLGAKTAFQKYDFKIRMKATASDGTTQEVTFDSRMNNR